MTSSLSGRRLFLAGLVVVLGGASAPIARPAASVAIRQAWTRPTPVGMNAAGYLTIVNPGPFADRLMSAASPAAARVSIHESRQMASVVTMRAVPALRIPPRGQVALAPGGYHLMLEALRRPLRVGDRVPVTLTFDRAGAIRARLVVGHAPAMSGMKM